MPKMLGSNHSLSRYLLSVTAGAHVYKPLFSKQGWSTALYNDQWRTDLVPVLYTSLALARYPPLAHSMHCCVHTLKRFVRVASVPCATSSSCYCDITGTTASVSATMVTGTPLTWMSTWIGVVWPSPKQSKGTASSSSCTTEGRWCGKCLSRCPTCPTGSLGWLVHFG